MCCSVSVVCDLVAAGIGGWLRRVAGVARERVQNPGYCAVCTGDAVQCILQNPEELHTGCWSSFPGVTPWPSLLAHLCVCTLDEALCAVLFRGACDETAENATFQPVSAYVVRSPWQLLVIPTRRAARS